jgi:hypothetical protein
MPRGGYHGGIRPRMWEAKNGQLPELIQFRLPKSIHPDVKTIALLIYEGRLSVAEILALARPPQ